MNGWLVDTVSLRYGELHDGETKAGELCPSCKGGGTGERSFSVTKRDGYLLWHCHRASCGCKGSVRSGGRASWPTTKVPHTRGVVGRTLARESQPLDQAVRQTLLERFQITSEHVAKYELGWDTETNRLCLPVQDFFGNRLGVNLRALDNRQPKTKLHAEDNAISWYLNINSPDIIIVEDQLSAIRASDYLTSVALLGTHLNDERIAEIKRHAKGKVFLALDADAWAKAVGYAIKYRSYLKLELVKLEKDLKNCTDEELREVLNE